MSGFTIVVKGEGGRTQLAEVLKQALQEKGFADVAVVPCDKADLNQPSVPFREVPIVIVEG
jgi:hypothetical protein